MQFTILRNMYSRRHKIIIQKNFAFVCKSFKIWCNWVDDLQNLSVHYTACQVHVISIYLTWYNMATWWLSSTDYLYILTDKLKPMKDNSPVKKSLALTGRNPLFFGNMHFMNKSYHSNIHFSTGQFSIS